MDTEFRDKMRKINQLLELQSSENKEEKAEDIANLKQEILEHIKEHRDAKEEYVKIQEDKLYDKYEITEENGKSESDHNILYAFVTFKSMKAKDVCTNIFSHVEALAKENPEEDEKKFMDEYIEVTEALPPGAIQWQNIGYSYCNRRTRGIIIWTLAFILVIIALILMVLFKDWNDSLKASASLDTVCPIEPIEVEYVLEDFEKAPKQRAGYMHCFCMTFYQETGGVADTMAIF
mmetsp:Transcript_38811/g.58991  ORF Transcript_38811/g.58991 Transcript_38811/m.58991 type:complete len:234 (+) Transcript_38811:140-841(+)